MRILEYVQGGNSDSDRELFARVGPWVIDPKVHQALGTAVTAARGDLWWVAATSGGDTAGFATARLLANKTMHLRFVYTLADASLARELIQCAIDHAEQARRTSVWTNDRETATVWKRLGFKPTPRARGSFVRWDKALKVSEELKGHDKK
jgi:hypothetical protein